MAKRSRQELPPLRSTFSGSSTGKPTRRRVRRNTYSGETAPIILPPELRSELAREQEIARISEGFTDYDTPQPAASRRRTRRRTSGLIRFLRGICAAAVIVFLLYSAAALLVVSRLYRVPRGERTVVTGTLDRLYVRTLLLIGTDAGVAGHGNANTVILLTLNSRTREIGMHSFLQDAYVEIPGCGNGKLGFAYSFGGAELLMDTIERNFNVSVDDYICVDHQGFAGMIDALGGVELTLTNEEAEAVNGILRYELNAVLGDEETADLLPSGGTYLLNGKQLLSYSQLSYSGNADHGRTALQRQITALLGERVKQQLVEAAPDLVQQALPHFSTNMNLAELYLLSLRVPFLFGYGTLQQQIPADGTWTADTVGGDRVLLVDHDANERLLRETAFAAQKTEDRS
ncbi:MAG: LCP family protein [Oscillospiraceae bacterium]|nr:LCP family protein [Oscillospiraceae bacterium]